MIETFSESPPKASTVFPSFTSKARMTGSTPSTANATGLMAINSYMFTLINVDGVICHESPSIEHVLGYSADELVGRNEFELVHPDDMPLVKTTLKQAIAEPSVPKLVEFRFKHKDGSWRVLEAIVVNIGSILAVTSHDITECKQVEEMLRESEEKYRLLFESNPLPTLVFDVETLSLLAVNRAALLYYGYSQQEFFAMTIKEIHLAEDIPALLDDLHEQTPTSASHRTWRHRKKDGTVVAVETFTNEFFFGGRRVRVVSVNDITERKQLQEQLHRSQKMEIIGRLAGGLAHDFNNLLSAILGFCDILLMRLDQNAPLRKEVEEIKKTGERGASLTRQLLTLSKKQMLRPRVLDLNQVIQAMEEMLRRLISEDIKLVINLAPELGLVEADPIQIEQVIINLVVNARDAMPKGGKLTIETANLRLDEAKPTNSVVISISDTGCGMSQEVRSHIFEPFFSTKQGDKGSGLGLTIVNEIIEQLNGRIEVYSQPGEGTAFKLFLPCSEQAVVQPKVNPRSQASDLGTESILLVEDDEIVRDLTRQILQMKGYRVLEASDADEALVVCERHPGPIHLMITDVVMPTMSGVALSHCIMPLRPEMKVLYISGHDSHVLSQHGFFDPNAPFLQKPFTADKLARKVQEVLNAPARVKTE
jgi:two-component system cell cycle sensor histidine kinase/response regulator CckA